MGRALLLALGVALALGFWLFETLDSRSEIEAAELPLMTAPGAADSLLVVAPHPDDESLCCAGIIQRAHDAGARVTIVWLTSGDAFQLDAVVIERTLRPKGANLRRLAELRMREADCAASLLGVPAEHRFFLGYPDGGTRALLANHYTLAYRSPYTAATAVPYARALAPGSSYEGRNLERDLERVVDSAAPTIVLAPSPEDRHPDHAMAGSLIRRIMARRGERDRVYDWIVHAGGWWPKPLGRHADLALQPPQRLRRLSWVRLPLDSDQRERKRLAIECHHSQIELMGPEMLSFDRADEIFARPAPRDSASTDAGFH